MKHPLLRSIAITLVALFSASGALAEDNTPGTFLIAPKFDIRGGRETKIRLVNASSREVNAKLNYICPGVKHVNEFCAALDRRVEFTPYQTRIIDVADQNPPCEQGFVVAFPVVGNTNLPVSHNFFYGSYHLIDGRRHESDNLITLQTPRSDGSQITPDTETFNFDFSFLQPLPLGLLTDFRATGADQGSRLVLLDLNILAGMQNPPAVTFIDFWNAAEEPFSTSHEFICWSEVNLEDLDLNFLEANLGSAHGSMHIEPRPTCPIPGTCPPNPYHIAGLLGSIEEYGDGTRASRTLHHGTGVLGARYVSR